MTKLNVKKRTSEIDKIIGNRIKELRINKALKRSELINKIGVTDQQLQKYEAGINRVSASRLILIANALDKNVEYFFTNLDNNIKQQDTFEQCIDSALNIKMLKKFATLDKTLQKSVLVLLDYMSKKND